MTYIEIADNLFRQAQAAADDPVLRKKVIRGIVDSLKCAERDGEEK